MVLTDLYSTVVFVTLLFRVTALIAPIFVSVNSLQDIVSGNESSNDAKILNKHLDFVQKKQFSTTESLFNKNSTAKLKDSQKLSLSVVKNKATFSVKIKPYLTSSNEKDEYDNGISINTLHELQNVTTRKEDSTQKTPSQNVESKTEKSIHNSYKLERKENSTQKTESPKHSFVLKKRKLQESNNQFIKPKDNTNVNTRDKRTYLLITNTALKNKDGVIQSIKKKSSQTEKLGAQNPVIGSMLLPPYEREDDKILPITKKPHSINTLFKKEKISQNVKILSQTKGIIDRKPIIGFKTNKSKRKGLTMANNVEAVKENRSYTTSNRLHHSETPGRQKKISKELESIDTYLQRLFAQTSNNFINKKRKEDKPKPSKRTIETSKYINKKGFEETRLPSKTFLDTNEYEFSSEEYETSESLESGPIKGVLFLSKLKQAGKVIDHDDSVVGLRIPGRLHGYSRWHQDGFGSESYESYSDEYDVDSWNVFSDEFSEEDSDSFESMKFKVQRKGPLTNRLYGFQTTKPKQQRKYLKRVRSQIPQYIDFSFSTSSDSSEYEYYDYNENLYDYYEEDPYFNGDFGLTNDDFEFYSDGYEYYDNYLP